MKQFIKLPFVAVLPVFILLSCSAAEDAAFQHPYLSQLSNTECLMNEDTDFLQSRSENRNGSFEMVFAGSVTNCKFTSLEYPCDFGKVNINVLYNDGVLTIVEYPSSDNADCRCEIDATFSIMGMTEDEFILKIYHGDITGNYDTNSPKHTGKVNIKSGSITIPYHV